MSVPDKRELNVIDEIDRSFFFNPVFVCPYFMFLRLRNILVWSLQLGVLRKSDQSLITQHALLRCHPQTTNRYAYLLMEQHTVEFI